MNKGIEILLARMESNPEEFVVEEGVVGKWDNIVRAYENVLNPEDAKAYKDARNALLQQQFTSEVMKELLDPKSEDGVSLYNITHPSVTGLGGATQGLYSNGVGGNATLLAQQQLQAEHIKAHVEALQQEYANVFNKPKRWWNKSIPELLGTK